MIWKLVQLPYNRGKGAAVQMGMLYSHMTGSFCLMVVYRFSRHFVFGIELHSFQMYIKQHFVAIEFLRIKHLLEKDEKQRGKQRKSKQ